MTDKQKKGSGSSRVSERQRFRYIGFEVFPGQPKDLFRSQAEKKKLEDQLKAKREKGEVVREDCKLLQVRVSHLERFILSLASIVMLAALLLPWYSAYTEIVEDAPADATPEVVVTDSLADTSGVAAMIEEATTDEVPPAGQEAMADEGEGMADDAMADEGAAGGEESRTQVLTSHQVSRQVHKEYAGLTGLGSFAAIGSVGSYVFGSGFILMISGVLMLVFGLLCIVLPLYNLYLIWGVKGDTDIQALKLKKALRLNWLPLVVFVLALVLSFIGADYGFDGKATFTSLGDSYGVGVFLGTISWGMFVAIMTSILVAAKGVEI